MLKLSQAIDRANGFAFKANPYHAFKDDAQQDFDEFEEEEENN